MPKINQIVKINTFVVVKNIRNTKMNGASLKQCLMAVK